MTQTLPSGEGEAVDQGSLGAARTLLRAARFIAPFRWRFALKAALVFVSLLPTLLLPWPLKIIIDHVILGEPVDPLRYPGWLAWAIAPLADLDSGQLLAACIAFLFASLLVAGAYGTGGGERDQADARLSEGHDTATRTENQANEGWSFAGGLFGLLDFRFTMGLSQAINHHYRSFLFRRVQSLPMTAFDDERIGDALYRVMYDTPSITSATYRILLTPVVAPAIVLVTALILRESYGEHPILVWAALATLPISLLATLPAAGLLRRSSSASRRAGATSTSTAEEGLAQVLAVQSLGGEARQQRRFDADSWLAFGRYRRVVLAVIAAVVLAFIPGMALAAHVFVYVSDQVIDGRLSTGDFAVVFGYFFRIAFSAGQLGGLWFAVQENAAGLERAFALVDWPSESDPQDAAELPPVRERIRVAGVDFDYPDGTPALRDIDLDLHMGELVALVGPAGAGKTTLAGLLPAFVRPTRGHVEIDGHDLRRTSLASLRRQVAFVFQETALFEGSVEDNIRLGRRSATRAEVEEAARQAGAHDFITSLPEGYATELGRGGSRLSVGQRQRLAIARALVREAPILVLDEPTAALDPESETTLLASLRRIRRGRIVLVIAHRLSTVREADRIVFLADGRIVEQGSHAELLTREGSAYRRFLELQIRGHA